MLRELTDVRQVLKESRRRWFADDYFDLIVWVGETGEFIGFQLCYDKSGDEHALTWHKTGFSHHRVDSGETQRPYKVTPILVADGTLDLASLTYLFKERSRIMDQKVARFVLDKIEGIQPELEPH